MLLERRVSVLENIRENQWYFGLTCKDTILRWLATHEYVSAIGLASTTDNYFTMEALRRAIWILYKQGTLVKLSRGIYAKSKTNY